jgi:hypothetical protein
MPSIPPTSATIEILTGAITLALVADQSADSVGGDQTHLITIGTLAPSIRVTIFGHCGSFAMAMHSAFGSPVIRAMSLNKWPLARMARIRSAMGRLIPRKSAASSSYRRS